MKLSTIMFVVLLLFSSLALSGCTGDQDKTVGLTDAGGDFVEGENATVYATLLNSYEEDKQVVVSFSVLTEEGGNHSEMRILKVPAGSEKEYLQNITIPPDETPQDYDVRIVVGEDEVGLTDLEGNSITKDLTQINATIANTNFESGDIVARFEVRTENDTYTKKKSLRLPKSSMDEYSQKISIPSDENPTEYDVQITEKF